MKMTGVILAGGKAARFNGENKSFIMVGGVPVIDIQLRLFRELFDEIIIVTNDCARYLDYDAVLVNDIVRDKGPLGGIYTALFHARNDLCFIAACDMPFLDGKLIGYMKENIGGAWIYTLEPVIKADDAGAERRHYQALHSIYSKKCMKTIWKMIEEGNLKISVLFDRLKAKMMSMDEAVMLDPGLRSLKNINTIKDLEEINETYK